MFGVRGRKFFVVIGKKMLYLHLFTNTVFMEDNEIMLLNNSKMYVSKIGKWMGLFSVISAVGMLFVAAAGLLLVYVSNHLEPSTPHYLDNVLGIGGIALIVLAVALIPPLIYMRRAVHAAKEVGVCHDLEPVGYYFHSMKGFWHYVAVLSVVLLVLGLASVALCVIFFLPTFGMFY